MRLAVELINQGKADEALSIFENRYWADTFMFSGKQAEARAKFIDAIIAEPNSQLSWKGLVQWAQRNNVRIAQPQIQIPERIRTWSADQKAALNELLLRLVRLR